MDTKKIALFRLHFIIFLWGFTAIIGKLIHLGAEEVVFYRMLFTSVFLFIFIRLIQKRSLAVSRKLLWKLFGIGGLMALHWWCFFYSIKVSNVSITLSCLSVSTLFASLIEPIVFKRKIDWREVLIGFIIMICMSLIFKTEIKYAEGIIMGIICAFFGALFSVFNGKIYGRTSSGNIIFYEIFGGWVFISLIFLLTGNIHNFNEINLQDLSLVLLLASIFTAFPMFESVSLMKYISPFTLILSVNLEPIYGIIFAYFIFGASENMSTMFYVASLVMIIAIAINGWIKSKNTTNNN